MMRKKLCLMICVISLLCGFFNKISSQVENNNKRAAHLEFVIIIPSYNNQEWCIKNIASALHQKPGDVHFSYEIIYVNDCSTDNTKELIEAYIKEHDAKRQITFVNNSTRIGSLANIYNTVWSLADHKIVVLLDGDDHLSSHALARVAKEYQDPSVWLTYGQYVYYPEGIMGACAALPTWVHRQQAYRVYNWVTSHLKTFRVKLFKKIKKEDLSDQANNFYSTAADLAYMYPMLEMASLKHTRFIPDVLYYYNYKNPICNHNIRREVQIKNNREIIEKQQYKPVDTLD